MARIVLDGLEAFTKAMDKVPVDIDRAARIITAQSAALIEARAKRNFIGSHARGMPHVGGNRPNVVTGQTRRSIVTEPVHRTEPYVWETRVGPTVAWGRRLELGWPGGTGRGRQATRPFPYVAPSIDGAEAQLHQIALTQWGRVFR